MTNVDPKDSSRARTLWMHIGHDKTGSSFLQAFFARQTDVLEASNLAYPGDSATLGRARNLLVTSGNAGKVALEDLIQMAPDDMDVLVSHEGLINTLADDPATVAQEWRDIAERYGFARINLLLFVRNPIEHVKSEYQQSVRFAGHSGSFDIYVERYRKPLAIWYAIAPLTDDPLIRLTLRNYSVCRSDILDVALDWLGRRDLPYHNFDTAKIINAGLSAREIALLRRANRLSPRLGARLALMQQEYLGPARKRPSGLRAALLSQQKMIEANADAMGMLNRLLPPDELYEISFDA